MIRTIASGMLKFVLVLSKLIEILLNLFESSENLIKVMADKMVEDGYLESGYGKILKLNLIILKIIPHI